MGKYYTLAEKLQQQGPQQIILYNKLEVKGRRIEEVIRVVPSESRIVLPAWVGEIIWALSADDRQMKEWLADCEKTGAEVPHCVARLQFKVSRRESPEGRLPQAMVEQLRATIGNQFCSQYGIE